MLQLKFGKTLLTAQDIGVMYGTFNAVEICLVHSMPKIRYGLRCVIFNILVLLAST
jgi:hypothetical protein